MLCIQTQVGRFVVGFSHLRFADYTFVAINIKTHRRTLVGVYLRISGYEVLKPLKLGNQYRSQKSRLPTKPVITSGGNYVLDKSAHPTHSLNETMSMQHDCKCGSSFCHLFMRQSKRRLNIPR